MSILAITLFIVGAAVLAKSAESSDEAFGASGSNGEGRALWYPYPTRLSARPRWLSRAEYKALSALLGGEKSSASEDPLVKKTSSLLSTVGKSVELGSIGSKMSKIMEAPVIDTARPLSAEENALVQKVFGKSIDPRRIVLVLSNGIGMPVLNADGSPHGTLHKMAYVMSNNLGLEDIEDPSVWREIVVIARDGAEWLPSAPASEFPTLGSPDANWKLKPEYMETLMHELVHAQLMQRDEPRKMLRQGRRAQRRGDAGALRKDSFRWMNQRFAQALVGLQKGIMDDIAMSAATGDIIGSYNWRFALDKGMDWDNWSEESQAEAIAWVSELRQGHVIDDGTMGRLEALWKKAKYHPLEKRMVRGPDPSATRAHSRRRSRTKR